MQQRPDERNRRGPEECTASTQATPITMGFTGTDSEPRTGFDCLKKDAGPHSFKMMDVAECTRMM